MAIAADHWATSIRATIREGMLQFLTDTYAFEKKTEQGKLDLKEVQEDLQHAITGGSITDPYNIKA